MMEELSLVETCASANGGLGESPVKNSNPLSESRFLAAWLT
jgi:hypothetical protein